MPVVRISRYRQYASPGMAGPAWKWIYNLPPRTFTMPNGRVVTTKPGDYSTKAETLDLVRRLYSERPLLVEWPDGDTTEVSR